jgi:mono/diheme cytochrome c family protein
MMRRAAVCAGVAVAVLVVWGTALGQSAAGEGSAAAGAQGRRLYQLYCASCHGDSGKGDGPDAAVFVAPPRNLREGFLKKYSVEDLVRRIREGQPLELALDLPALRARAAEVEELATHVRRLPAIDWHRAGPGMELFAERCAVCHGETGKAPAALPPGVQRPRDLSDPAYQRSVNDKNLSDLVRHGREHMPALVPRISEPEARQLGAFVRLLSPGYTLYATYCAVCHGEDGKGNPELTVITQRPTIPLDAAYFKRRDAEQLRAAVWHMLGDAKPAMPHYRALLSEEKARAIVEYLQSTE